MTAKEFLIAVQREKVKQFLNKVPGDEALKYVSYSVSNEKGWEPLQDLFKSYNTAEDEADINSWDEDVSVKVANLVADAILYGAGSLDTSFDSLLCPWCMKHFRALTGGCNLCTYGKRHYICEDEESIYQRIIDAFLWLSDSDGEDIIEDNEGIVSVLDIKVFERIAKKYKG